MNLIDRYIAEVGKHLPRKNRADIEAEIRSTLEDMLDERTQGKGPADEATVMELLKEYGAPREVAATYKTHQYLIGPRLFPIFEMIIRIVFAVVTGVSLIGLGVSLAKIGLSGPAFAGAIGSWFGGLISGLIAAFGNITLVFAILERTSVADKFESEFKEWDPKELKSEPDPEQIDLPDHIATIIFTVLGLVVLNLYPGLFSIRFLSDGTWITLPVLTEAFFRFLPWINLMGMVQIVFSGFMLGQRTWNPATRILGILIDIAGMVLGIAILRTPGIFGLTPEALNAIGIAKDVQDLTRLFNYLPTLIIAIIVLATTVKVIKSLLRLFSNKSGSPYPVLK
jgi:HAAS domain-containing protein